MQVPFFALLGCWALTAGLAGFAYGLEATAGMKLNSQLSALEEGVQALVVGAIAESLIKKLKDCQDINEFYNHTTNSCARIGAIYR